MTTAVNSAGLRTVDQMNKTDAPSAEEASAMDADGFMTLMLAQLENQDPLSPTNNTEFMSQLSQMSTVQGISDLNTTMTSMATQLTSTAITEASSMLGQKALVSGSTVRANDGQVGGRINLTSDNSQVKITYADAKTGEVLHSQQINDQLAGNVDFSWEGAPSDGRHIRISAQVSNADGTLDAATSVYARIEGVEVDPKSGDLTLQVQDYGYFMGDEITALR